MVKHASVAPLTTATVLRHTPVMTAAPRMVSNRAMKMPRALEAGSMNPSPKNLKYSATTSPAPTGSISLRKPATKSTLPSSQAQSFLTKRMDVDY